MKSYYKDPDPQETEDWLDSLAAVIAKEGGEKADCGSTPQDFMGLGSKIC